MWVHTIRHCFNENIWTKQFTVFINAWLTSGVICGDSGGDYFGQSNVTLAQPAPARKTWYVEMEEAGPPLPEQKANEYVSW